MPSPDSRHDHDKPVNAGGRLGDLLRAAGAVVFRRDTSDRSPRRRTQLSEAEFRRLEDEQESMYQHGNKMDNGPIGPYGSL